jgi:hypothetical protein
VEFDTMGPMGADMQKALHDLSGQKSVPNLFINGKHIGMFQIVSNIYSKQQKSDLGQSKWGSVLEPTFLKSSQITKSKTSRTKGRANTLFQYINLEPTSNIFTLLVVGHVLEPKINIDEYRTFYV